MNARAGAGPGGGIDYNRGRKGTVMVLPERTPETIHELWIPTGRWKLPADVGVPAGPIGVVIFAHGSGSSRRSARNRMVAEALRQASLATILMDLLTEEEAADRANVFDIEMLAARLLAAARWARQHRELIGLPVGLFGASTGAAAALVAAADDHQVAGVVSRGGRPDLAMGVLGDVLAPTLLVVGGEDHGVLGLNERALGVLRCPKRMEIIPGATHLFEEPGALERVAATAREWLVASLSAAPV
jgi:putative phosphoribosyl transferase